MTIDRVGYGAGDRDLPNTPNVLRVLVGESTDQPHTERIVVLQSEIDDMNPQLFGLVDGAACMPPARSRCTLRRCR